MDDLTPEGLRIQVQRKPGVKLAPGPPHIVIAVPVGAKSEQHSFPVPPCDQDGCTCPNHGKTVHTGVRAHMNVASHFALSLQNQVIPLNTTVAQFFQGGMLSAQARDLMTRKAIECEAKYLMYWDDDVVLSPLTLYTLHNQLERYPDIGLLAGVYCTRETPTEPLVYKEHGKGAWWHFSIDPEDPPEDIFACGGGCIMVRVEELKKMEPPFWTDEQIVDEETGKATTWGHDIRFVRKFREETGKRTCVKGSILGRHWDAPEGRFYDLPEDAPNRLAFQKKKELPAPAVHEIVQCPSLTPEYVDKLLRDTGHQQRIFMVEKSLQPRRDLRKALTSRFSSVKVVDMEGHWMGVCEGLKNGKPELVAVEDGDPAV